MSAIEQEKQVGSNIPIAPVDLDRAPELDDESRAQASANLKRVAIVSVSVVLFFVLLTVIFVLPRFVQTDQSVADDGAEVSAVVADDSTQVAQVHDPAEAAVLRRTNQARLEQALALVTHLKARNVTQWAAVDFEAAINAISVGEKAYTEQRYEAAESAYAEAIESLQRIAARTEEVVSQAVDEGFLEIASRNSTAAAAAFEFALSIEHEHEQAKAGLARARTLDQVTALVNEAEGYEDLGNLDAALQRYGEAVALDGQAAGATSAIARIKQVQLGARFKRAMSDGFAALEAKKLTRAKSAFARAIKIRPRAQEALDVLEQVENQILANRISQHLRAAISSAQQEKWVETAAQYRAAVKLDADLDGAATSAERATDRAKLDRQLESMIDQPHRLGSNAVHQEAQTILGTARSITQPGPRLSQQINRLADAIKIARTPIAITLVSDNATEVTLYKVGPLGRFERHSVSIIPGRYVVVGRRNGFRDARVEFEVSPDHHDAMITVRCEEKLAFESDR